MISKYAIVECTTEDLKSNLLCYSSICSIRKSGSNADIYVITYQNNPFNVYYEQLGVKIVGIDQDFVNVFKDVNTGTWSYFIFSRYAIFKDPIFRKYEFALYLDTDTIVYKNLDLSYSDFLAVDGLGMVPEQQLAFNFEMPRIMRILKTKNAKPKSFITFGKKFIPTNTRYCNSGVLVIKNKIMTDIIFDDLVSLIQYEFTSGDQDILNIYFGNSITYLDPKYNLFCDTFVESYFQKDQERLKDVVIQHLCGANFTKDMKLQTSLRMLSNTILANKIK